MIVVFEVEVSAPSLAESLSTYVPTTGNVVVVALALAFAKVTSVTGPETKLHLVVSAAGEGFPSSLAVPLNVATPGPVAIV
jgi:hypothetical protein